MIVKQFNARQLFEFYPNSHFAHSGRPSIAMKAMSLDLLSIEAEYELRTIIAR